ncbi:hypothetical protein AgCh_018359 [Apium graveolens]
MLGVKGEEVAPLQQSNSNDLYKSCKFMFVVNADAKVCDGKTIDEESSGDADHGINFKRASNSEGSRKRRIFIDSSNEEDEFRDAAYGTSASLNSSRIVVKGDNSEIFSSNQIQNSIEEAADVKR